MPKFRQGRKKVHPANTHRRKFWFMELFGADPMAPKPYDALPAMRPGGVPGRVVLRAANPNSRLPGASQPLLKLGLREQDTQRLPGPPLWVLSWRNKKVPPPAGTSTLVHVRVTDSSATLGMTVEVGQSGAGLFLRANSRLSARIPHPSKIKDF